MFISGHCDDLWSVAFTLASMVSEWSFNSNHSLRLILRLPPKLSKVTHVFLNLHSGPGGMHGYTDLPKVSRTTLKSAADIGLYFLKAQSKVPFVGAHGTYSVVGVVVIRVAMV